MSFRIAPFLGEVPRAEPRDLPAGFATVAQDCRLDRGSLEPLFNPTEVHTFGFDVQTIYRAADGTWLGWNEDVDVAPGPVATDRLYITGDGTPKIRLVDGGTREMALGAPNTKPDADLLRNMREYLRVGNREVRLVNGATYNTDTGVVANVSITGSTATVTLSHPTGITAAAAQTLVNGLGYRNTTSWILAPGLKLIEITEIKDNGGRTLDDDRNLLGGDSRKLDGVISKVFVGGTKFDQVLPEPGPVDATNESGQNDPPTLSATALNPSFPTAGGPAVSVFSGATVGTVESGQLILRIVVEVSGLANGAIDKTLSETVLYSYTHVTDLDEESAPAPLSSPLLWSPGHAIRLTGFSPGSESRGVNRYRIYRSQTASSGETLLYFIAEVARGTSSFIDEVGADPIGEPIPSTNYESPPADLRGITAMPNGMMAGFVGKTLYFCEPYRPHTWPRNYSIVANARIVGLASIGSALAILTAGAPALAQGTHPENVRMEEIEVPYPCRAKRSIVALSYGVAYASSDGLVVLDAQGGARVVTKGSFTGRQWYVDMNPPTFRAGRLDDLYALSYDPDNGGRRMALIDLSGELPYVTRVTDQPTSFHLAGDTGRLFYLDGARVVRNFDPAVMGSGLRSYRWISRLYVDAGDTNLGAVLVECDQGSDEEFRVRLFGDGKVRGETTRANKIMALPSGYRARRWQVEITGKRKINAVTFAHSAAEIPRMAR